MFCISMFILLPFFYVWSLCSLSFDLTVSDYPFGNFKLSLWIFNVTFNNIPATYKDKFIDGRKPPTCHKSMTNFIAL